jgi:uncharacterized protein (TIGR03067 family)
MQASLLIGLALALGAPAPKDAKTEPGKIEGNWVAESYVLGGKDEGRDKGVVFTFADGRIKRESEEEVSYVLNPKADPPQIDLTPVKGKQAAIHGIYKIDGDTLLLCFTKGASADRPTKFESPDGSRIVLFTLKREKKKD